MTEAAPSTTTPLGRFRRAQQDTDASAAPLAPRPRLGRPPRTTPATKSFNKDELVRLHVDIYRWRRLAESSGLTKKDAFRAYDENGVLPTHIHAQRGAHAHAIRLLSDALRAALPHVDTYADANRL